MQNPKRDGSTLFRRDVDVPPHKLVHEIENVDVRSRLIRRLIGRWWRRIITNIIVGVDGRDYRGDIVPGAAVLLEQSLKLAACRLALGCFVRSEHDRMKFADDLTYFWGW